MIKRSLYLITAAILFILLTSVSFSANSGQRRYGYPECDGYQHGCNVIDIPQADFRRNGVPEKHEKE